MFASGGSRNIKTGGRGRGAVEFLGSEDCSDLWLRFCLVGIFLYSLANILPYELHVHLYVNMKQYVNMKHDIDMRLTYDMLTCKASFAMV